MARHLLPGFTSHIIVSHTLTLPNMILGETSLSFLGLGDPIQKSWGSILFWAQARGAFLTPAWKWWVLPPGLMIMAASLGFALIAFAMEERINPRL